ncbi:MAG TPA: histidine kinase, partial [Chitinophagaceae bacterium]|nr:histidine kinase [Chitinophagaceae bacterium]
MKMSIDKKKIIFYLWLGLAYFLLRLLFNAHQFPGNFFPLVVNNLWRIAYIIAVNFIFFEYTVPFVLRKRKFVLYNIFLGILFFWLYIMLWSFVAYAWRAIGIGLGIYTPLTIYDSIEHALEAQMAYSMGAVFFFG